LQSCSCTTGTATRAPAIRVPVLHVLHELLNKRESSRPHRPHDFDSQLRFLHLQPLLYYETRHDPASVSLLPSTIPACSHSLAPRQPPHQYPTTHQSSPPSNSRAQAPLQEHIGGGRLCKASAACMTCPLASAPRRGRAPAVVSRVVKMRARMYRRAYGKKGGRERARG
jgi:hypothetical protein